MALIEILLIVFLLLLVQYGVVTEANRPGRVYLRLAQVVLLIVAVLFFLQGRAHAQCRGGCGGSAPAIVNWGNSSVASFPAYEWRLRPDGDIELLSGSSWVGYYRMSDATYHPWTGIGYGIPARYPPTALPTWVTRWQRPGTVGWQTTGVNAGEIAATERTTFVGSERARCAEAPAGPERVPDLSGQYRVTPIGSAEECAQLEQDWRTNPALAQFRPLAILKSYRPTDPQVVDRGFVTTGHPSISVQAPDATEVRRFEYYPGAETLASFLAGDLRRPNPNFNPAATPGLGGSGLSGSVSAEAAAGLGILAVFGGLFLYLRNQTAADDGAAIEGVTA